MGVGFHSHRDLRENLEFYLKDIPFQLYVSLTHHGKKSVEYADFRCRAWLDGLERHHRAPVGVVRTLELGATRNHPHHHLLLLSTANLDPTYAEVTWKLSSGNRSKHSVKIEQYDPEKGALAYVLKLHGTDFAELELRNLEFFLPTPAGFWTRNAQTRRQFRRHASRVQNGG